VLTVLKAALNKAFSDGKIGDDTAWRKVKPFSKVDAPRIRYLNRDEVLRLLNACDPDMRELATGALQTGCRYGELTAMVASDFDPDTGAVFIRNPKSGHPRHAYLTDGGREFFTRMTRGKERTDLVFLRNGRPWNTSEQQRPIKQAAEAAGLEDVSFHVLRHTYGTFLAQAGVPLQIIAEALGHADTRITGRHYAHLMPSYVKDTVRAALPSFGTVTADNVVPLRRAS
jgi:integrase